MDAYYYVSGRKVQLDRDEEYVAVDQKAAQRAGLEGPLLAAIDQTSRQGGGVVLTTRVALGEQTITSLRKGGALQPVYRHDRVTMVALPEVRVEFDTREQRQAVIDVLSKSDVLPHRISESTDDRLIVQPISGDGDDALKIANEIYERAKPAAASVRFIQFVPKPSLRQ